MRLLITVTPRQITPHPVNPYHIQSFIYSLLKETEFDSLHGKRRYKYFCFSNIFPYKKNQPFRSGELCKFMISSPERNLIDILHSALNRTSSFRFGQYEFNIVACKPLTISLRENNSLITATPVVVSIPKSLFTKYEIKSDRKYLYWNSDMPLNAFVDAVSKNSVRKFNKFYDENYCEELLLFRSFRFKRGMLARYKEAKIAGSSWEFTPNPDKNMINVLKFVLDSGLGEKNSAGFGFINLV